uniref:Uncharacterized protein n=1 Tax=Glossina pallidipes TaxID=7398 RepID=A0A1A9ZHJ5_GLOPL
MIEILINSLYIDNVKRNAKNCQICENEKLGSFLKSHNVINVTEMWKSLYISFNDTTTAFEDTRETTLNLMQLMPAQANSSTIKILSNTTYTQCNITFEDMDQSLEMLIARSAYIIQNTYDNSPIRDK